MKWELEASQAIFPSIRHIEVKWECNTEALETSDVQVCHQGLSSVFDLLLILCSLIQTLTLTPPPNNPLLANMDM